MTERIELATERIKEIHNENILNPVVKAFFDEEADFLTEIWQLYNKFNRVELCQLEYEELENINKDLYSKEVDININEDIKPYLMAMDAELKACILYLFEKDAYELLIRTELFLEVYSSFICSKAVKAENPDNDRVSEYPKASELRDILYYYTSDYMTEATDKKITAMFDSEGSFALNILMNSDWSDKKSLFYYGEYVSWVEIKCLEYINSLPEATLRKMADTFTEGYRIGFEVTNKDLSKKKLVEIRYHLGFEPVIKIAVENFEAMGLKTVIKRNVRSLLTTRSVNQIGYEGAVYNKQYLFDHKEDLALIMDKSLNTVRLEALQKAFEKNSREAALYAGPACMEIFGEDPYEYKTDNLNARYSDEQQKMLLKYSSQAGALQRRYIIEEERSFTIIAFPTPDIGKDFEAIFDEVVKLNTLDYMLYRNVQQTIIDTLDKGDYCIIKGCNGNKTNIKVNLCKLNNPEKETIFENCVADVNIPVGEVFTSPVLEGTEGTLHVSKSFLNEFEYHNLKLEFADGKVTDYSCDNFGDSNENRKFIKDNLLFHHDTLPVGEFAIGTNTVAYTMSRKYDIANKLPILIAEKTGPHFAIGDTCYSHVEKITVYNPDGKEIVAKENSCSRLRDEDEALAYFNCHTDITIPYDELGEISVVTYDNEVITIIENGRFVLEGTEFLNEALAD